MQHFSIINNQQSVKVLMGMRYGDGANEVEMDTDRLTIMFRNVHGKNITRPAKTNKNWTNENNPWINLHKKFVPKLSSNHDCIGFSYFS